MQKIIITLIYLVFFLSLAACKKGESWSGVYTYDADLGKNIVGDVITMSYRVSLSDNECKIDIQGYQVDEQVLCTLKIDGNSLGIRFKSYADGKSANAYGTVVYSVGETLLCLEAANQGLVTHFISLLPDENHPTKGRYFTKANVSV